MTALPARYSRLSAATWVSGLGVLAAVSLAAMIALTLLSREYFNGVVPLVIGAPCAGVGLLVARRQPRNPIGWLFLAIALCLILATVGGDYAFLDYRLGHDLPLALAGAALSPLWGPGIVLFAVVILLFPDGRLPSARWRLALRGYYAVCLVMLAGIASSTVKALIMHPVRIDPTGGLSAVDNPAGWPAVIQNAALGAVLALSLIFIARQVLSWRHSSGERRQQLKWLASGAAATVACAVLASFAGAWPPLGIAWLGFAVLPLSIGVAILRYRLYDIDRIISRTLAYAIVTGLLVGVYAGLVILATEVLSFSSPVAVAASTLAAAALFSPLRRRVQRIVDRRFNRARYDADRTIAAFADRLQDATDLDAVRTDLLATARATLEPVHASVWLSGIRQ